MKKLLTMLITVSLLFNLAACGDVASEPETLEPEIPEDAKYPEAWAYFAKLHYGDYMFRDYGIDDIIGEDEDGEWWECNGAEYAALASVQIITLQQGYEDVNQFMRWACSSKTYEENGVFTKEYSRLPDGRYRIIFKLAPWSDSVLTAEYEIKDGEFIW